MDNFNSWIKYDVVEPGHGRFVFEPLERGMGATVGNAMRRVLLSALGGFSVSSLWISGVKHEFSQIDNVKEDMIEVIANLKGVILNKPSTEFEQITFVTKGKKDITAKDIFADSDFTVVNPDHHIISCSADTDIEMKIGVQHGVGYVLAKSNDDSALDMISIDANFSPVLRVNHFVEKKRVGNSLDNDSLTLEVWVDGSVSPEQVVKEASTILAQRVLSFQELNVNPEQDSKEDEVDAIPDASLLDKDIDDLDFSARTANALKRAKILNLKQLLETKWSDLENIKNFGAKCKEEVRDKIKEFGVVLES
eukprot:COSAG01_NODE_1_length_100484_cov_170.446142_66_plen_308_part_00